MTRFWMGVGCFLLCTGCAIRPHMPQPQELSSLPEGTGVVFGSMTRDPSLTDYDTYMCWFAPRFPYGVALAPGEKFQSIVMHHDAPFDINEADREGDLFGFVLPAGEYKLTSCELHPAGYGFTFHYEVEFNEDQPPGFKVVKGAVSYLGDIHFRAGNLRITTEVQDFLTQDDLMFRARYPGIDWSALRTGASRGEL